MRLHDLSPAKGSKKPRKRLGRGVGSGTGKTAGRGSKGHRSRSGGGVRPGFEGGQMPIHRRLPKRGFTNIFKKTFEIVNIKELSAFGKDSIVDQAALVSAGIVKGRTDEKKGVVLSRKTDGIKLLGKGEIDYPLTIRLENVSKGAREKIEAAGGKIETAE